MAPPAGCGRSGRGVGAGAKAVSAGPLVSTAKPRRAPWLPSLAASSATATVTSPS